MNTFFTTALAGLLFPGAILSLPAVPINEMKGQGLAQRMFLTMKITWKAVLLHLFIYLVIVFLWFILIGGVWEQCPLA